MLTPTSSLPSIPSTPNRVRDSSTERLLAGDAQAEAQLNVNGRPTPSIRGTVEQFQARFLLRSAHLVLVSLQRVRRGSASTSLFNRGLSVNVQASPRRSPLVVSTQSQRQQASTSWETPSCSVLRFAQARPPDTVAHGETASSDSRGALPMGIEWSTASHPCSVARRPNLGRDRVSRRESFNSVTSAGAAHTLSHSRRSSAVLSPNSPALLDAHWRLPSTSLEESRQRFRPETQRRALRSSSHSEPSWSFPI